MNDRKSVPFANVVHRIFEGPWGYRYIRGAFHFGVRKEPIRKVLELKDGDRVLDVGSGTGDYSMIVDSDRYTYLGVDLDQIYVNQATKDYGRPFRQFKVLDIRDMSFPSKSFDKAMCMGVLHHLNDEDALVMLKHVSRIITDRLVISDLGPGGWHVVNNLLCRYDRGQYPRKLADQVKLVGQVMDVVSARHYYVRSGVQRYSLLVAKPRS